MKRLVKSAAFVMSAALLSQAAAHAQANLYATPGDLILGFVGGTASTDYIVDLGQPNLTPGSHTSLSNPNFTSAALSAAGFSSVSGANAGVVSSDLGAGGNPYVYLSTAHGSHPAVGTSSSGQIGAGSGIVSSLAMDSTLTATISTTDPQNTAWSEIIARSPTVGGTAVPGNFAFQMGDNPMTTISGTTLVEDIWNSTTTPGAYHLLGTLTVNFGGANPVATFDAVTAVPEPSTYGLIAGAGLLLVSLRRQFSAKSA